MIRRYLIIAIRNLHRQKLFTLINIAGLAVSMTICLIVMMHQRDVFSYDKFHSHADRIWRITTQVQTPDGRKYHMASTPLPMGEEIRNSYPAVEKAVTLYAALNEKGRVDKKKINVKGVFTTPSFFDVFGFKLAAGDPRTALNSPNSIILTTETAQRFFGVADPMGKMISFDKMGNYIVTGILQPNQGLSHIDFDAYASLSSVPALEQVHNLPERLQNWDILQGSYTYVLMRPGKAEKALDAVLNGLGTRYADMPAKGKGSLVFEPQALSRITPSRELYDDFSGTPPWAKILTEVGVGLLLLICACFNYTNLSIVRSLQRAREVGVRKVNGAMRWQVFMQFITESVFMCFIALVLAVLMLLAMQSTHFSILPVPDINLFSWQLLVLFFSFSLITGIVAGVIPAWALSSFQPAKVLKNMVDIKLFGGLGLRKTLIVIQFTLSLTAIVFLVTVYRQFHFKAAMDMGFQRKEILNVPLADVDYQLMKERMLQLNGVTAATASSGILGMPRQCSFCRLRSGDSKQPVEFGYYAGDANFVKIMDLKLLAGTTFPEAASANREQYVIINERAVSVMGLKSPADAIGKALWLSDTVQLNVIGVVKDFNYQPIEVNIQPFAIRFAPQEFNQLQLAMAKGNEEQQLAGVKTVWQEMHPGETFTAGWMDEQLYERISGGEVVAMLSFLVSITTMIASLGLLGIVAYTSFTRRKEISIRKVLGATVMGLMLLLSRNYIRLIIIAGCIALPLGYIGSALFLQLFAYRVNVGVLPMLGSFGILVLIALVTIFSQTWRAIDVNPVNNLRND